MTLSGSGRATAHFIAPSVSADTALVFKFTATDNGGTRVSTRVTVTVRNVTSANIAPTVSAGSNQAVNEQMAVTLRGNATDPDGVISKYHWRQVSGPAVTLSDAGSATAHFTAPSVDFDTHLVFKLTATDNNSASVSDRVTVTVRDGGG